MSRDGRGWRTCTLSSAAEEDAAEYQRRLALVRELMRTNGFDGLVIGRDPSLPDYARYLSNFYIAWQIEGSGEARPPENAVPIVVVPLSGPPSLVLPHANPRAG